MDGSGDVLNYPKELPDPPILIDGQVGDIGVTSKVEESEEEISEKEEDCVGILSGIKLGLDAIRKHTRSTLSQCTSAAAERADIESRLEKSTLGLLRTEKCALETSRIVSEVVEEFLRDEEEEEEDGSDSELVPFILPKWEIIRPKIERMNRMFSAKMEHFKESLKDEELQESLAFLELKREINLVQKEVEDGSEEDLIT